MFDDLPFISPSSTHWSLLTIVPRCTVSEVGIDDEGGTVVLVCSSS